MEICFNEHTLPLSLFQYYKLAHGGKYSISHLQGSYSGYKGLLEKHIYRNANSSCMLAFVTEVVTSMLSRKHVRLCAFQNILEKETYAECVNRSESRQAGSHSMLPNKR